MTLVLIGEAPERRLACVTALEGRIGRRIARLAGVPLATYLHRTIRINIYDQPPERWNRGEARKRAKAILAELTPGARVVIFGRKAIDACGFAGYGQWQWMTMWRPNGNVEVMLMPHPSGRNRWWNAPGNVALARHVWTDLLGKGG
jgi:hypothetical protein